MFFVIPRIFGIFGDNKLYFSSINVSSKSNTIMEQSCNTAFFSNT